MVLQGWYKGLSAISNQGIKLFRDGLSPMWMMHCQFDSKEFKVLWKRMVRSMKCSLWFEDVVL